MPIEPDNNMIVSSEGNLLIGQARLQDTANYTCVAENVAAKRLSDPALLTVYGKFGGVLYSTYILMHTRHISSLVRGQKESSQAH